MLLIHDYKLLFWVNTKYRSINKNATEKLNNKMCLCKQRSDMATIFKINCLHRPCERSTQMRRSAAYSANSYETFPAPFTFSL